MDNETSMAIHRKIISMRSLPTVRQLRAFVAVYYTGHVTAAAELLSLTQPAVTVLLRELEEKLGVKLFDRTTRTLRRTEAAVEALAFAERVLSDLEALGASMTDLATVRRGRLRLACTSSLAQTILPLLMRQFFDLHPGVELQIDEVSPGDFSESLLAERADIGIGTVEGVVAGLRDEVFQRDTLSAVALADTFFADEKPITWKQLAKFPLITVQHGYGVRRRIMAAAQEAGVQLNIQHEVALLLTALAMAAHGLGVAVVPGSLLSHVPGVPLLARRIVRPTVERNLSLVYRDDRDLSPAAQSFRGLLMGRQAPQH